MRRLEAKKHLTDEQVAELGGEFLTLSSFDELVAEDSEVYREDGSLLLKYRKDVLSPKVCRAAHASLRTAAKVNGGNRGMAGGKIRSKSEPLYGAKIPGVVGNTRWRPLLKDGTLSNTDYSKEVPSGIAGFFDRYDRIPYCRLTAFNLNHPEKFAAALPFIRAVDSVFAREVPDRHAAQASVIARTSPDFHIKGTAFTTLTVNRNWQTAVHQDAGDYQPGFGVMAALRAGEYRGGFLVFPQYRVAVDMQTCGVLMADVHEWHGNTPIVGRPGEFERISCVFYYRENMHRCGSAAEELERAKNRKRGQGVWS